MSVEDQLDRLFSGHRSLERAVAWEAVKGRLPPGSPVRGVVVARHPFGVFVDIDAGFPALILVVRLRDADKCPYTDIEGYPRVGSVIEARVCVWAVNNGKSASPSLSTSRCWEKRSPTKRCGSRPLIVGSRQ